MFPCEELFRILFAHKLEQEQKNRRSRGVVPLLRRFFLSSQSARGQNAAKLFAREHLLHRLGRGWRQAFKWEGEMETFPSSSPLKACHTVCTDWTAKQWLIFVFCLFVCRWWTDLGSHSYWTHGTWNWLQRGEFSNKLWFPYIVCGLHSQNRYEISCFHFTTLIEWFCSGYSFA